MWRWRRTILTIPRVQPNVMMIATGRNKHSAIAIILHYIKAEDVTIEFQCSFKVSHLKMNMTDSCLRWYFIIHGPNLITKLRTRSGAYQTLNYVNHARSHPVEVYEKS